MNTPTIDRRAADLGLRVVGLKPCKPEGRDHFEATFYRPVAVRMELIDAKTLCRYRHEGRDGMHDEAGGKILWIERIGGGAR